MCVVLCAKVCVFFNKILFFVTKIHENENKSVFLCVKLVLKTKYGISIYRRI